MQVKIAAAIVVSVAALMVTIEAESVRLEGQYDPENMTYESVITNNGEDCGYFLLFYLSDEKEYEDEFKTKLKNLYDREFIIFSKSSTIHPGIYFLQISVNPENKIVNDTLIKNSGENETLVLNFIKILRGDYMNGCTRILYDVPVRVESVRRLHSSQSSTTQGDVSSSKEEVAITFRILPNSHHDVKRRHALSSNAHLCGGLFQQPQFMCPGEIVLQQQQERRDFMERGENYVEPCATLHIVSHVPSIEAQEEEEGARRSNRSDFIASRRTSKEAPQHGGGGSRALAKNNSRKEVRGEAAAMDDDESRSMADLHIQILSPKKTPAGTYRDDLMQYFGKFDLNKKYTHHRNSMGNVWTSDDIKLEDCKSSDSFIEPLGPCDIPYFGVEANYDCRNFFDPYDQDHFGYSLDLCEASLFGSFDFSPCDLLSFGSNNEPCIIPNDAFQEDMSRNSSKKSLSDIYIILLLIAGILLCIGACFFGIQTFNNTWARRTRRQRRVRF